MPPGHVIIVLYPRTVNTAFDLQFYREKHVPLTNEIWGPYGMKMHSVSEMDTDSGYHLTCVLEFPSIEAYEKASADERTKELIAQIDEGRFTRAKPVFLAGTVVG